MSRIHLDDMNSLKRMHKHTDTRAAAKILLPVSLAEQSKRADEAARERDAARPALAQVHRKDTMRKCRE